MNWSNADGTLAQRRQIACSVLDLSHNSITSLPSDIAAQSDLTELKLQWNIGLAEVSKLESKMIFIVCIFNNLQLPSDLGLMRKLWNLELSGCRVREQLQSVLGERARCTKDVLGFLKSIKEE